MELSRESENSQDSVEVELSEISLKHDKMPKYSERSKAGLSKNPRSASKFSRGLLKSLLERSSRITESQYHGVLREVKMRYTDKTFGIGRDYRIEESQFSLQQRYLQEDGSKPTPKIELRTSLEITRRLRKKKFERLESRIDQIVLKKL